MARTPEDETILDQSIAELPLSADFKERSTKMGFATLRQVTGCDKHWLHHHLYFSRAWYNELVLFLKKQGLLRMMNG
ncbi:hypothetical protein [Parapedobacter tibetensis]|nr:hypothetical protein [Parapedobacter tibetensis]